MGDVQFTPPSMSTANSAIVVVTAKIVMAAVITIFFLVMLCVFLILCASSRWQWGDREDASIVSWRRRTARRGQTAAMAARKRGLDRATLNALPVIVYDPKDFKEGLECAVCLSEVSEGEKARLLPKCNHGFHVECIDMWFKSHSTCPLCRNPVVSTNKSENDGRNNDNVELEGTNRTVYVSDSDSDSDSDSEYHDSAVNSAETAAFPTNVLFWGDESQVRAHGEAANATASSTSAASSSNAGGRGQRDELVIEIPRDLCDDWKEETETKTPVVSRLRSLRRLLSRGKRVSPSNSSEIEAV